MSSKKVPSEIVAAEKMSVEKAVQRIHDMCVANTHRLMKLEEQFNQMSESVAQKNEKIDTQIVKIERQISEIHMETTSKLEEDKQKFDEIKQQSDEIMQLLHTLRGKEQVEAENIHDTPKMMTNNYAASNRSVLDIGGYYSNYTKKVEPIHPTNDGKMTKSCTVTARKPTVPPTFSGTYAESPNQLYNECNMSCGKMCDR
jgi:TolA-binding protein